MKNPVYKSIIDYKESNLELKQDPLWHFRSENILQTIADIIMIMPVGSAFQGAITNMLGETDDELRTRK